MTQQIEADLWSEFESELKKREIPDQNIKIISPQSEALAEFWNKFLTQDFPTGRINEMLEKNFAIYICFNKIDIESIKNVYQRNNWRYDGLIGWIKKVNNGEITTFNIKELLMWANDYSKDLAPLLERAKTELEVEDLPFIPIDELDNLPEQPDIWLCRRLIRPKSINAIAGKRATLKTWLCLALAASMTSNIPFLGKFGTTLCNVGFMDAESNKDELKIRKKLVQNYLELKKCPNFFILSEHYLKLDSPKGILELEKAIKRLNLKLIIVDNYRRFISYDENDATLTSDFFTGKLKPLCNKLGVAILFIHHEKKGNAEGDDMDTIRGSSDFVNLMDSVIQTKRVGKKITIKQTKNKFGGEVPAFNLEIETDQKTFLGFKFLGLDESYEVVCAKTILKWAKDKKSFTYTSALKYALSKNFTDFTFKKALKVLQDKGLIEKGSGKKSPYQILSKEWGAEEI